MDGVPRMAGFTTTIRPKRPGVACLPCLMGHSNMESGPEIKHRRSMSRPPASAEHADHPRLSKRVGARGLCSRREARRWVPSGWMKVDGKVVHPRGVRVSPDARIEVDPAARAHQSGQVT